MHDVFRRKLAKLRRSPKKFLVDSPNVAFRAIGALFPDPAAASKQRKLRSLTALSPRALVEQSGLFDAGYYSTRYPDVRRRGHRDLLAHYLKHGVREARSPNAMFDPQHYARQAGIRPEENPLIHYLTEGEALGLQPHPRFDPIAYRTRNSDLVGIEQGLLQHYLKIGHYEGRPTLPVGASVVGMVMPDRPLGEIPVTIVIPVFNNRDHVRRCIDSVLTYTGMSRAEVLLIDDASSDPGMRPMLARYGKLPKVTLLRNEQNLGFTRTVNRGIQHARGRDVVLLNSDTVVSPRWLELLALAAYGSRRTASATALSDNAGAFSTPAAGKNATLEFMAVHTAARLNHRAAPCDLHYVPTGNGFCMYLRHDALDEVGLLDEVAFPRGYGEENDWCMRAAELGFHHVIALRAYVHHVNAVSFGAGAKEKLIEDARKVLDHRHPDYTIQIRRAFGPDTALGMQRQALGASLEKARRESTSPRPRVLFVLSTRTGGTPLANEDLMRGVSHLYDPLLLVSDTRELQLYDYSDVRPVELARHSLVDHATFVPHTSVEYDAVVTRWLVQFGVELMHIRHIAWHGLGLVQAARTLGIPVIFSFHDFYAMCPSVNLTNGQDPWFEGGVTSPHIFAPLWVRRDAKAVEVAKELDAHALLALWKRRMNTMLSGCDAFITTSPQIKEILSKNLPILTERSDDFHVIPHGRDFEQFLAPVRRPRRREPLRVLIAGNIVESKGLNTTLEILRLDKENSIELHLIGTSRDALLKSTRVRNHGPYARKDFNQLVSKIKPHVGFIPSIWPETFCHTLTECWAAGLPVVGSELGAVGERIRESGAGWTVDPLNAREILALFRRIRSGEEDWSKQVRALTEWRQTTAEWDVAAMSERYLDVYSEVMLRHRPLLPVDGRRTLGFRKRIAVIVRGHFPQSMPTSHVRIATQLGQATAESIDYDWIDAAELLRTSIRDYDGVVVCRNAGPPAVMSELARQCKKHDVPLVFDLDDDLLDVPRDKDPGGVYPAFAPALRDLLSVASLTTVSTSCLAELYAGQTPAISVVPNRLDPRLWLAPVPEQLPPPELDPDASIRVLYMGSPTHHEDLELVLPAFERLRAEHGVALHIVGVTGSKTPPPGVVTITPPNVRYDNFVLWFRSVVKHFDIAIAPLVESAFNRSKSGLKFMEYAAVGLPVIASRVVPYVDIVRDGVDGLLADNHDDAWFEAVSTLATDPDLRARLTQAAARRAELEFVARACVFDQLPWDQWRSSEPDRVRRHEAVRVASNGVELEVEV